MLPITGNSLPQTAKNIAVRAVGLALEGVVGRDDAESGLGA